MLHDQPALKLTLHATPGDYPMLAPLDPDARPSCQQLIHKISKALNIDEEKLHFHCFSETKARRGSEITLVKTGDQWQVHELNWYNGWLTLSTKPDTMESLSKEQFSKLFGLQAQLLHLSGYYAKRYPGLGMTRSSLPMAAWQWLTGSYKKLGNGALASWHSYEFLSHGLQITQSLRAGVWGHITLDFLSLIFHGLEGMEHADHAGMGSYIHLDFHGDLIAASRYPHATNIGLAGAAMVLNLIELLRGHAHGHTPSHTHAYNIKASIHALLEFLHTGLHVYELGDALNDWISGNKPHSHDHDHDHSHDKDSGIVHRH